MKQSKDDLLKHYYEQIDFIKRSCESFDAGFESEGKRLATCIRILVHDTDKSTSLLTLLDLKGIHFYDTADDWNPKNLLSHSGLTMMKISGKDAAYVPKLDDSPPGIANWISFDSWWNKIVLVDDEKNKHTRKDIVLAVCNKDGGAHIDPKLNDKYAKLSRYNSLGWVKGSDGSPLAGKVELIIVRQIAHEIAKTLEKAKEDGRIA